MAIDVERGAVRVERDDVVGDVGEHGVGDGVGGRVDVDAAVVLTHEIVRYGQQARVLHEAVDDVR